MPNSMIQKDAREGKGSTKSLEKKWDRAKDAAGTKDGEQNWALTNYIYQKMTSSAFDALPQVEQSAVFRIAAHLAIQDQAAQVVASELTSGDLNTPQGDEPECNTPGAGGAPTSYEYQDEDNTPGVQEFDGPDCDVDTIEVDVHGDDVIYAGFAQYNLRILAALGGADNLESEEATVSPSPMGTGSSPVEFQDSVEVDPQMGPAAAPNTAVQDTAVQDTAEEVYSDDQSGAKGIGYTPDPDEEQNKNSVRQAEHQVGVPSSDEAVATSADDEKETRKVTMTKPAYSVGASGVGAAELPTGAQPKKPEEPVQPVQPVEPVQPKQAAATQAVSTDAASRILQAEKWSSDVKTEWHPPEGFFEGSAEKIAKGLKRESSGLQQAMSRLNFYINRAGSNLSAEDKSRLEHAKDVLHDLYGTEKGS